jgi:pimeloyl-ACP methyl ester carboxylesterase
MIELFAATGTNRTVRTFERSGHFSYLEEPEEYAKAVTAFAREHAR